MQLVWSLPSPLDTASPDPQPMVGNYQEMLRSLGAWLDARGYRLIRVSAAENGLIVEVETGQAGDDLSREIFRLEFDALQRLVLAARSDRDRFDRVG
jgi:hypothetical protein